MSDPRALTGNIRLSALIKVLISISVKMGENGNAHRFSCSPDCWLGDYDLHCYDMTRPVGYCSGTIRPNWWWWFLIFTVKLKKKKKSTFFIKGIIVGHFVKDISTLSPCCQGRGQNWPPRFEFLIFFPWHKKQNFYMSSRILGDSSQCRVADTLLWEW